MAEQVLHFENARFAQQLFNHNAENLVQLEKQFNVRVIARDGWIKLDGEQDQMDLVQGLFLVLESAIKGGTKIRNREFHLALNIVQENGLPALQSLFSERLVTSQRKQTIQPKTLGQKKYIEAIRAHDVTFGIGPAGTGKTFLAMAMAIIALKEEKVSRIILTRPAVEAGEALGFLPGDLAEKIAPYLRPLHDALYDMLPVEEIEKYMERNIIEIAPLAYMRGRTLNHAFIILDEAQNSTAEQLFMFLTRLGQYSRAVITGDPTQIDLPHNKESGLLEAKVALANVPGLSMIHFEKSDVVRHPLVQRIIKAYEDHRYKGA